MHGQIGGFRRSKGVNGNNGGFRRNGGENASNDFRNECGKRNGNASRVRWLVVSENVENGVVQSAGSRRSFGGNKGRRSDLNW